MGDENWRSVGGHYFSVFRIPLLRGRIFNDHDTGNSARVVVINEAMAKKYWKDETPSDRALPLVRVSVRSSRNQRVRSSASSARCAKTDSRKPTRA